MLEPTYITVIMIRIGNCPSTRNSISILYDQIWFDRSNALIDQSNDEIDQKCDDWSLS